MSRTEGGFSLLELLVTISVISLVTAAAGGMLVASRRTVQQQTVQVETGQALRFTLDTLARDLRLGGACLPMNGTFIALSGRTNGLTDSVITRAGLVRADLTCIRTALRTDLALTDPQLAVDSADGFAAGMWLYIRHPNGTGEFFNVTAADPTKNTLQKSAVLSKIYPAGSGVYALDERAYAIDTSDPAMPVLTIATNGTAPIPFASGVEQLDIQYRLARNCPNCDVVDFPATDNEWALVTEISASVTVRSRDPEKLGQYIRRSGHLKAKPRNLLPRG